MAVVGVGTDLVDCERIQHMIDRHGDRFLQRVFSAEEIRYCSRARRPAEHFAARFAAKEAILKALGTGWIGRIAWADMALLPDALGKPQLALTGHTAALAEQKNITRWHVSMSHTRQVAIAVAIAESR
jgi:holo-[acyl-carrier protein] synthase